jgi:hypothetical protein
MRIGIPRSRKASQEQAEVSLVEERQSSGTHGQAIHGTSQPSDNTQNAEGPLLLGQANGTFLAWLKIKLEEKDTK